MPPCVCHVERNFAFYWKRFTSFSVLLHRAGKGEMKEKWCISWQRYRWPKIAHLPVMWNRNELLSGTWHCISNGHVSMGSLTIKRAIIVCFLFRRKNVNLILKVTLIKKKEAANVVNIMPWHTGDKSAAYFANTSIRVARLAVTCSAFSQRLHTRRISYDRKRAKSYVNESQYVYGSLCVCGSWIPKRRWKTAKNNNDKSNVSINNIEWAKRVNLLYYGRSSSCHVRTRTRAQPMALLALLTIRLA